MKLGNSSSQPHTAGQTLRFRSWNRLLTLVMALLLLPIGTLAQTSYGLTVAGVEVTSENASNVTGSQNNNGRAQVSFDAETNTLTLEDANITITDASIPFIESGLDLLRVYMKGGSSVDVGEIASWVAFKSTNAQGKIIFEAESATTLTPFYANSYGDAYPVYAFSEEYPFATVSYAGTSLYLNETTSRIAIQNLMKPSIGYTREEESDAFQLCGDAYGPSDTKHYYTIDYASSAFENVPKTEYVEDAEGNSPSVVIYGPATITAWDEYNGATSATAVAKLFGLAETKKTVALGDEGIEVPAVIPAISETDGLAVNFVSQNEDKATVADGIITLGSGIGLVTISANLQYGASEPDFSILNSDGMLDDLTLTILPPAPSVNKESGTYDGEQTVTVTSNLPANFANTQELHFIKEIDGVLREDSVTYDGTIAVKQSMTLHVYQRALDEKGNTYRSDTLSLDYVIRPMLDADQTFAAGKRYATFYTTADNMALPAGVAAYVVTGVSGSEVTTQALSYIPKNVPVLLESGVTNQPATNDEVVTNLLRGAEAATDVATFTDGTVYVLYGDEFVKSVSGTLQAGRACLVVSAASGAPRRLSIGHGDGTTAIETVTGFTSSSGFGDVPVYDLGGRPVVNGKEGTGKLSKGVYIRNGKKFVVK